MNSEKLKGHILILITNILFAVNMPISKYLLPAHVPPPKVLRSCAWLSPV